MARDSIKIINAALDEVEDGKIILRGVIDPDSLHMLQTGPYQREILPLATITKLVVALKRSSVPDIELGMRGEDFAAREGVVFLRDPVFIIDGLQRVTAGIHMLRQKDEIKPRIGAAIHFHTTEAWERDRFRILNANRVKLSPNVLLRNLKEENVAVKLLFDLTNDSSFVLQGRICWHQRMLREHLITARTYLRTVSLIHAHISAGRNTHIEAIANSTAVMMEKVGANTFRTNTRTFFDLLDQMWGIRRVAFKEGSTHLRSTFLWALAQLFSQHEAFWREKRLFVDRDLMRKIAQFPITDPEVARLASAGGMAGELLYQMLIRHINSGKRDRRLVERNRRENLNVDDPQEEEDSDT